MAELHASTPFEGLLPIGHGAVEAAEWVPGAITSVAPFKGQEAAISAQFEAELGVGLPAPGRFETRGEATILWTGLDQWFVLGQRPGASNAAAMTDQSDAWACASLSGAGAADVLARLCPIDLGQDTFAPGHVARTLLGHMPCILVRFGAERFGVMVFRSMAGTACHELERAMRMAAARADRD